MEYKALLIVVVGIVIEARGNPFAEEKMMEETPPACTEDPQVCKGIVDYLNAYCLAMGPIYSFKFATCLVYVSQGPGQV